MARGAMAARMAVLGLGVLGLAACAPAEDRRPVPTLTPAPRPAPVVRPPEPAASEGLRELYARLERDLIAGGKLRRDTAPADAPYTADDLVRDFERVALNLEYTRVGTRFVKSETPAVLRRWDRPVRVGVVTRASLSPEAAARDREHVAAFARRLGRLTGLDFEMAEGDAVNYLVVILDAEEQAAFAAEAAGRYGRFAPVVDAALTGTPADSYCDGYTFADAAETSVYAAAMVLIPAEHPPFTRLSCLHEEMAQSMGLPNDSPEVRPSLFNDSIEFALLTDHDEILLRMLYDPRLHPGMTAAEVRPLLPAIARDAMAAEARDRSVGPPPAS